MIVRTGPVPPSKREVFEAWAAEFNASVNAIHGPWLPQKNEYSWKQWGESRCDKACFEAEIFANNSHPECHPELRALKTEDHRTTAARLPRHGNSSGGVIDVTDFGAVCDGKTDSTAAIQAALNAGVGKVVHFPHCGVSSAQRTLAFTLSLGHSSAHAPQLTPAGGVWG